MPKPTPTLHMSAATPVCSHRGERGFTLIELIMVVLLLGILAAYAAPRLFNRNDLNARGFHDETLAYLRYAQKTAIAQRRMVCVTFNTTTTPHTAVLTMENPTPTATPMPTVTCGTNVVGPRGDSAATVSAEAGVTYSSATSLIFDGLGQPVSDARVPLTGNITVRVASGGTPIAQSITIEAGTGYVHE